MTDEVWAVVEPLPPPWQDKKKQGRPRTPIRCPRASSFVVRTSHLEFQEFQDVVRTNRVDNLVIRQRKDAYRSYQALTPPRVITSDGEVIDGAYRHDDLPAGVLVGLPDSAGILEGRSRVVLDMAEADLKAGDILVTAYTDPSSTPDPKPKAAQVMNSFC